MKRSCDMSVLICSSLTLKRWSVGYGTAEAWRNVRRICSRSSKERSSLNDALSDEV